MNKPTHNQVLAQLERWEEIDLPGIIGKMYPDNDLSTVSVGDFDGDEFVSIANRVFIQFDNEFSKEESICYPNTFQGENHQYNWSNINLITTITQFINLVGSGNTANLAQAGHYLRMLTSYQMQFGFWDIGRKVHHHGSVKIGESLEQLETLKAQLKEQHGKITTQVGEVEERIQTLNAEVDSISQKETAATTTLASINETKGAVEQCKSDADTTLTALNEDAETVGEQKLELKSALDHSNQSLSGHTKLTEKAKKDAQFIEAKKEEIIELVGMAAGGALGAKFDRRKLEVGTAVTLWLVGISISVLASAVWIIYAWVNLKSANPDVWVALASNIGLLLPPVFLLGFVGKQYTKERQIMEEYAFKGAVAMTLNAFADEVNIESSTEERKKLIMDTVKEIYTPIKIIPDKNDSTKLLEKRSLRSSVETLTDALVKLSKSS